MYIRVYVSVHTVCVLCATQSWLDVSVGFLFGYLVFNSPVCVLVSQQCYTTCCAVSFVALQAPVTVLQRISKVDLQSSLFCPLGREKERQREEGRQI